MSLMKRKKLSFHMCNMSFLCIPYISLVKDGRKLASCPVKDISVIIKDRLDIAGMASREECATVLPVPR
jgi:hypothetical protein